MNKVLVLDFGSQFTQLIARAVRNLGVFCVVEPYSISEKKIRELNPSAIILSGGPSSVGGKSSPKIAKTLFDLEVPILGICYGMQLISHLNKGKVASGGAREYGFCEIEVNDNRGLFSTFKKGERLPVWMSHGDHVGEIPPSATATASSEKCVVAFEMGKLHAIQFHPEVAHTPIGMTILSNFLFRVAGLKADWKMGNFLEIKTKEVLDLVGEDQVIGAVSGGVDSTVLAVFLGKILGKRFHPFLVDTGLLRKNEAKEVVAFLKKEGVNIRLVDASKLFLSRLKKVSDPEKKRKIIGKTFIEIFDKETKRIKNAHYLAQGTLYPDVIESVSVKGPSHTIKTHHNVGGLPKKMKFTLVEPFRELFKDEVRALGRELGIPNALVDRHPFPGPGLAVRIIGDITPERVKLLQEVDSVFIDELRKQNQYEKIWQAFAVLLPINTVGVMGDARTYESVVALRAVTSRDGMTADWYRFENTVLAKISSRIVNEVRGVNRVVYDISSKPPATIEWE